VLVVVWKGSPVASDRIGSGGTQRPSGPRPPGSVAPPGGSAPPVAQEPSLIQLARVDPPPYEPLTLRGAGDEATRRFHRGMKLYERADYRDAMITLSSAAALDPRGPHICFFLGISHLLLNQNRAAVEWLQATIALGDSAYLEDAHFYLAKALLRQNDLGAAQTHLKRVVQLRDSRSEEARQLLTQLERLRNRSD